MRTQHRALAAILSLFVVGGTLQSATPAPAAGSLERWIVRLQTGSPALDRVVQAAAASAGARAAETRIDAAFHGAILRLDARRAAWLRAQPGVLSVERDSVIHASGVQASPPANLDRIDQRRRPVSHTYTSWYTGAGVKIYVIDSGINLKHKDFAGRIQPGPDYADDGGSPSDCAGHGTHVAGIAAGTTMGVAKKATIVPVKVLDCEGAGYVSDAVKALDWVVRNHKAGTPAVANLSLFVPRSTSLDQAVATAIAHGITVVTAAGNYEPDYGATSHDACTLSPAAVPGALTVANSTSADRMAASSEYGRCVDLFAPGSDVLSDFTGSSTATARLTGSSMSAPAVAGAAALVLQARPRWTPARVGTQILNSSTRGILGGVPSSTPNRLLYTLSGVTPGVLERTSRPTITGTTRVGQVLVSHAGSWGNAPVRLRFTWYRVPTRGPRVLIPGARAGSYRLTAADKGKRIMVAVSGYATDHRSASTYSSPTGLVG